MIYLTSKRIFDVVSASLALLLLSPFLIILLFINSFFVGPSVFFLQKRVGLNLKSFYIIKMKTMVPSDEEHTANRWSHGDMRITQFGEFLREYSLDELPSLINVVLGHMSVVGPRPLLEEHVKIYSQKDFDRHLVRPGITGLAQVRGRNNLSWRHRLMYDRFYVAKKSWKLDIRIILETVMVLISREGYNPGGDEVSV